MDAPLIQLDAPGSGSNTAVGPGRAGAGGSFHELLSALNPLQYLPVVGSIYRAVTGDIAPEPLRMLGSLVASALLGGPIGVLLNLAATAVEKLVGVDPDSIAHHVAADLGVAAPQSPAIVSPAIASPDTASPGPSSVPRSPASVPAVPATPAPAAFASRTTRPDHLDPPIAENTARRRSAIAAYARTELIHA